MSVTSVYVAVPPSGQNRHTVDPPNLDRELAAVGISITILALVAVILQLFTRAHVTKWVWGFILTIVSHSYSARIVTLLSLLMSHV
jgi:hypothetical protein